MERRSRIPLAAVALVAAGCSDANRILQPDGAPAEARIAGEPAPGAAASFEIDFMQDMIDHHQMAVMTAEMCLEEAVHDELRALCESIIATQSREIEQMQGWLNEWYWVEYTPEVKETGSMRKLASLQSSEFEIAFMEMMIKHHQGAIREAETCLDRAYHDELLDLCEAIIAAQSAEIEQMREWLCEWYGECRKEKATRTAASSRTEQHAVIPSTVADQPVAAHGLVVALRWATLPARRFKTHWPAVAEERSQ